MHSNLQNNIIYSNVIKNKQAPLNSCLSTRITRLEFRVSIEKCVSVDIKTTIHKEIEIIPPQPLLLVVSIILEKISDKHLKKSIVENRSFPKKYGTYSISTISCKDIIIRRIK